MMVAAHAANSRCCPPSGLHRPRRASLFRSRSTPRYSCKSINTVRSGGTAHRQGDRGACAALQQVAIRRAAPGAERGDAGRTLTFVLGTSCDAYLMNLPERSRKRHSLQDLLAVRVHPAQDLPLAQRTGQNRQRNGKVPPTQHLYPRSILKGLVSAHVSGGPQLRGVPTTRTTASSAGRRAPGGTSTITAGHCSRGPSVPWAPRECSDQWLAGSLSSRSPRPTGRGTVQWASSCRRASPHSCRFP